MTNQRPRFDHAAMAIGQTVRGQVVAAGLSQQETADGIGMSLNTFSRRVNGRSAFTYPELRAISRLLGVPLSDLIATAERLEARYVAGLELVPDKATA